MEYRARRLKVQGQHCGLLVALPARVARRMGLSKGDLVEWRGDWDKADFRLRKVVEVADGKS